MRSTKGYFYFILWIAGAVLLLYYGNSWMDSIAAKARASNKQDELLLAGALYPVVLGAYASLLFGIPGRFKAHKPILLGLFLPCFLLFIYPVVGHYVKLPELPFYADVMKYQGRFLFGIISGMSLMHGLFESKRR